MLQPHSPLLAPSIAELDHCSLVQSTKAPLRLVSRCAHTARTRQHSLRPYPSLPQHSSADKTQRENSSRPDACGRQVMVRTLSQFYPRALQLKLAKGLALSVTHPPSFLVAASPAHQAVGDEKEVGKQCWS